MSQWESTTITTYVFVQVYDVYSFNRAHVILMGIKYPAIPASPSSPPLSPHHAQPPPHPLSPPSHSQTDRPPAELQHPPTHPRAHQHARPRPRARVAEAFGGAQRSSRWVEAAPKNSRASASSMRATGGRQRAPSSSPVRAPWCWWRRGQASTTLRPLLTRHRSFLSV
jgi:hypothetical protein